MFFLNEKIDFLIFDFDHLMNPYDYITPFLGKPYVIHVLTQQNPEPIKEWLARNHIQKKWLVLDAANTSTCENLEHWLNGRPWAFHDVFLTGNNDRVEVANERAIGTVLIKDRITFEDIRTGADLVLFPHNLQHIAKYKFLTGNAGEMFMDGAPHLLPGAAPDNAGAYKFMSFTPNFQEYELAYALGRFFSSSDSFLNSHLYSRYIKSFKGDPNRHEIKTSNLLKRAIDFIKTEEKLGDIILSYVPKKPSDQFDRNLIALDNLQTRHGIKYDTLLKCNADYPSQKMAGSFSKRRENVSGKYESLFKFNGQTALLFDDIYTSGSTLAECASALKREGIGKVVSLSLAVVCDASYSPLLSLNCSCGRPLKIYFKKSNAQPFWNCYEEEGCKRHYMDYSTGVSKLRALRAAAEDTPAEF